MNHLKMRAKRGNSEILETRYIPTRKNKPITSLCEEQGFKLVNTSPDGEKKYSLSLGEIVTVTCDWIDVKTPGDN